MSDSTILCIVYANTKKRIEDENSFLSLLQIEEYKRAESELKDAFCKYQVIFDFYQFMKVNVKE
jgi:hypothetical protein